MATSEEHSSSSLAQELMARHMASSTEPNGVTASPDLETSVADDLVSTPASAEISDKADEIAESVADDETNVSSSSSNTPKTKKSTKIDLSSFDAFPKLGALNKSSTSAAGAWSKQPTLKPVKASAIPSSSNNSHQVIRAPPKVQTASEIFNLSLEQRRFKIIPSDLLSRVRTANNVHIDCSTSKHTGVSTFIIKGKTENVQKARRELFKGLTVHVTETIKVPASSRASIIGPKGSNLRPIIEKSGAQIQVAKKEDTPVVVDDEDDEPLVDVIIEGDREGVEIAKKEIQAIVSSRVRHANLKISSLPSKVYPALAGVNNASVNALEKEFGVKINIPDHFYITANDLHLPITISGERSAAIEAKTHIEQAGKNIIASSSTINKPVSRALQLSVSPSDVFTATGVVASLNSDGLSWELFGSGKQIQAADAFISEAAEKVKASLLEISKAHGNNVAHGQILARYFNQSGKLSELEKEHGVILSVPSKETLYSPNADKVCIEIVGNDVNDVKKVRTSLISLVNKIPPTYTLTIEDIDPFFFKNLQPKSKHATDVKSESVQILVPEDPDYSKKIAFVYESKPIAEEDDEFDFMPSPAEIMKHLEAANKHLNDIRHNQKDIVTAVVEYPLEDHKYILGPNGTTLNAILKGVDNDSFVNVHLGDSYKPEGLTTELKPESVVVRGLSKQVKAVVKEIEEAVEEGRNYIVLSSYTTSFQFPAELVNRLIGKGGANLTKIREEFGVKIDVNADGEGVVKGIKKNAEEAKLRIHNLGRRWADEVTLRLAVPNQYHATLIGTGGKFVKRLEEKYDVQIRFPRAQETDDDFRDKPSSPDEIVIRGPSRGAAKAKEEILELVQYEKDNNNTDVVLVPVKALSRVIGRGGEFINDIKDSTNTRIDVGEHGEKDTKVPVTITGTKTGIKQAAARINEIVKEIEDTVTEEIDVDPKYHRYLIGANGSAMRDIISKAGEEFNPRLIQVPQAGSGSSKIKVHGRKKVVSKIVNIIKGIVDEREKLVEIQVPITVERHGSIIGPAGQTKKEIETECGVIITVPYQGSKNSKGELEKNIKVIGAEENVEKAKKKILEIAADDLKVDVPIAYQNLVFDSGMLIKKLRSDLDVRADLGRASFSKDPFSKIPADAIGETLITDENPAAKYKWTVVAESAATAAPAPNQPAVITWRFKGTSENCKKAKDIVEKTLARAKKYDTTGYLWLADPSKYRLAIGPAGSTINNIREKSGCSIAIPKASAKKEENAVVIRGEKSNVEKAMELILEVVKRN